MEPVKNSWIQALDTTHNAVVNTTEATQQTLATHVSTRTNYTNTNSKMSIVWDCLHISFCLPACIQVNKGVTMVDLLSFARELEAQTDLMVWTLL